MPKETGSSKIAASELPQSRYDAAGPAGMSDSELIAMLLHGPVGAELAVETARRLLAEAGSLSGLATWTPADYGRHGISRNKASQLATLPEIARRILAQGGAERPMLNRADLVFAHMHPATVGLQIEKFWVLCLNRKNRLIHSAEISSGTATAALAHPREVFRTAIREAATAIICVHNHPSGDPAPSAADLHLTRQLREAAKAVDIDLIDHVVIGRPGADPTGRGYYSFREAGVL